MRGVHDAFGAGQEETTHLAFLEKVRYLFADKPDVYNNFVEVMQHFNAGAYVRSLGSRQVSPNAVLCIPGLCPTLLTPYHLFPP
jgi:hypothetical protein